MNKTCLDCGLDIPAPLVTKHPNECPACGARGYIPVGMRVERARIQVELWDRDGVPELEYQRERLETLISILRTFLP